MLKKFKRIIAAAISSVMILTSVGCTTGKNTAYALTVDGYQVKAGVYIYYSYTALTEAKNLAAKQDENLDVSDEKSLKKIKIEGKDFLTFVKDKTTESCVDHVAVMKHFDELELSLTQDELDEIDEYVESSWQNNEDMFTENGISKDSIKEIMTSSYKSDAIFKAYYGEGGSENVTEDQLKDFYTENNARVKFVDMDMHDSEGNDLDEAGKKELQDMAKDFIKRAESADSEEAMLEEFDKFQEEYDDYVADKAAESSGEETTEATTEPETEPETETTTTESDDEASDNTENTEATESTSSTEDEAVTTAPESDNEETTSTTTNPYANETIIQVVTTAEGAEEEPDESNYKPSKEIYDWIFNDAKTGVPEIVEDEDTMYVIVRLDITERMDEDDLWSESNVDSVRYKMFSDDLQDMLDSWGEEYEVVKNDKAYKRYDPFKIKAE